jgi:hypothetical protein
MENYMSISIAGINGRLCYTQKQAFDIYLMPVGLLTPQRKGEKSGQEVQHYVNLLCTLRLQR